jgi:serine/threonine protein kinase
LQRVEQHAHGAWGAVWWLALHWLRVQRALNRDGLEDVRPWHTWSWKADVRYLTASRSGKPLFLKVLDDSELASRELAVHGWLLQQLNPCERWFAPLVTSGTVPGSQYLAFQRLEAIPLSRFAARGIHRDKRRAFLTSLSRIHVHLIQAQLIHRDIRPANILVPATGTDLILIDFAFAVGTEALSATFDDLSTTARHRRRLQRLGHGYNPGAGTWDDAYSLARVMEYIDPDCHGLDIFEHVRNSIGQRVYRYPALRS